MELDTLVCRVRNEFLEMPDLRLSMSEAMRLWGLDEDSCRQVIEALIQAAFLRKTPTGQILRLD